MNPGERITHRGVRLLGGWRSFGAWLGLVAGGYVYVASVLCGRGNPLLSGNGIWDFALVVVLSPLFFCLGPRHNWRPPDMSARAMFKWNGLCYGLPFFVALHWEYLGNALGAQFSLKSADLGALDPRSAVALAIGLATIAGLLAYHLARARRAGILGSYVVTLTGIPCIVALITLSLGDACYLHVHHYNLGAYLFPFFRFRTLPSLVAQAVFLGLAIEGVSRWGMDPMWYCAP